MFTQYRIGFRADRKDIWYSMDNSSTELEQVAQTQRTLCRSGWPRGFAELKPSPHSRIFTFVLVGSSPRSYLLTSVTVRIPAHTLAHTAPKCGTVPIQRVTLSFGDRARQLRSETEFAPKSPTYVRREVLSRMAFARVQELFGIVSTYPYAPGPFVW